MKSVSLGVRKSRCNGWGVRPAPPRAAVEEAGARWRDALVRRCSADQAPRQTGRAGLPPMAHTAARLAHGLGDAVQRDGQQHNAQTTHGGQAHVEAANAAQHHLAQAAHGNHGGNHHHGQRQHQRLVDAAMMEGMASGKLHLEQHLQGEAP
jgi:hypothetical protein